MGWYRSPGADEPFFAKARARAQSREKLALASGDHSSVVKPDTSSASSWVWMLAEPPSSHDSSAPGGADMFRNVHDWNLVFSSEPVI